MRRDLIKTGLAAAFHRTGVDRAIGALVGANHVPLVVGYHRVVEDFAAHAARSIPAMLISRTMLERHLDWIASRFRVIALDELESRLDGGKTLGEPVAAITFDDGYQDVYDHAFPLLQRKGLPAAVFVVTDLIGTSDLQLHDALYLLLAQAFASWPAAPRRLVAVLRGLGIESSAAFDTTAIARGPLAATRALFTALPQADSARVVAALEAEVRIEDGVARALRPLSWEMLSEMHRAGITIGSHTKSHAVLTNERPDTMAEETAGSRRTLEKKLGVPVRHFAYPDGRFSPAVVSAVASAGYRLAFTTCRHRDPRHPRLTLPRRLLWEHSCVDAPKRFSPSVMSCQVNGVFDLVARCRQRHAEDGGRGRHAHARRL